MSSICRPVARSAWASSDGRRKRRQSWVPRGSQRSRYSAPTMAMRKALGVRLRVERIITPPGRTRSADARRKAQTSATCSTPPMFRDRKRDVEGQSETGRVDLGGRRHINKKKKQHTKKE